MYLTCKIYIYSAYYIINNLFKYNNICTNYCRYMCIKENAYNISIHVQIIENKMLFMYSK